MADDDDEGGFGGLYEDGHWLWDDTEKALIFVSDLPPKPVEAIQILSKAPTGTVEFRDDIDLIEQIADEMANRIMELEKKIRTPDCEILEHEYRDNLADLRLLVAKEYSVMLIGGSDTRKFHHMGPAKKRRSLSDKDARLFETLLRMCVQIVWLAIGRKSFNQIELETNRIFKSEIFNAAEHTLKTGYISKLSKEERVVLLGHCLRYDKKLNTRSPLMNEVFCHRPIDYRMMGLGVIKVSQMSPRLHYMLQAIAGPEDKLVELGVVVEGSANKRTVRFWFKRFRDGNFNLKNEPRGRPPTQVNNDKLREMVEADPSQTSQELAAWFNVTLPTILTHLCQINKIKKYEKWVPHDLTDLQKETRVVTCVTLLNGSSASGYGGGGGSKSTTSMGKSTIAAHKLYPDIVLPRKTTKEAFFPPSFPEETEKIRPCSETQRRRWQNRLIKLLHPYGV
ncbi:unnamed protein product [Diatraea saccharalis]|uniref:Mos1 transposase HTH domain-containing protein n=1 Tax=Diatraea saccharalis TaxID=40085 RepID=A0A9N9R9A5_9NEOP|nr:unnamed protein product [Diatraea saccharalis]